MSEAGWGTDNVTAERIRDTLREQGNVLSPYVVSQCIDDLLKSDAYAAGWRDALTKAHKIALQQRCERGTPWDLACVTIADLIEAQAQGGEHGK